jgi:hypothetical protein
LKLVKVNNVRFIGSWRGEVNGSDIEVARPDACILLPQGDSTRSINEIRR